MLAIDYTTAVAAEAREAGCNLIVAYHPPIFDPVKRLNAGDLVFDAIPRRRGDLFAAYGTAEDMQAEGGTNDLLALFDAIGMTAREPLRKNTGQDGHYKLVVFVPQAAVDKVSRAVFDAGAGRIGQVFISCSFRSAGTGTFSAKKDRIPRILR